MVPAQPEILVEQRAGEQPEHHDIAGRHRDQRRMPCGDLGRCAERIARGMRHGAERKADGEPPGQDFPEFSIERSRQDQQHGARAGSQGELEMEKRHQDDPLRPAVQANAVR